MCGIVAAFSRRNPVSQATLERATRSLYHRGPDGQRWWISGDGKVGIVGGPEDGGIGAAWIFAAPPCSLDIDGNNTIDPLTDGLMLVRAMFGLTGSAVTDNAVGANPSRSTWAQIQPYLNGNCGSSFAP